LNRFLLALVIVLFPLYAPAAIVKFSATPSTVNAGDSATVAWRATNVKSCTVSGAGKSLRVPPVMSQSGVFTETTRIRLQCGSQSKTLTVRVIDGEPEPRPEPTPNPTPTPNPNPNPTPTPTPNPNPNPTASCGSPYQGIPDPCAQLGFDIYAQYDIDQSVNGARGDGNLSCNGTAANPCVIDAGGASFERVGLSGQYAILQGATVNAPAGSGPMVSLAQCNNCVIRDSHVIGPKVDSSHSSAVAMGKNTVWLRGSIRGFGDNRQNAREQDYHGIKIMTSDVWVLDAEITDVSGDSVQCGDASRGDCNRVYIGGGYMHHNRENAIDIKNSRDVVVSNVRMAGFRPTGSSPGEAVIVHDSAYNARILNNTIQDSTLGIVSSGESGHVIEGNKIQALSQGIQLRNTSNITVRGNQISAPTCVYRQSGVSGTVQTGCN
jgi:parallel beta-helix repeat protein